ncbi:exosortase B [Niveibacterium umoris]|uniref:Exosortase B n=1 Tax=Niveibacterium umoris TaxID=1193620 RepID=A0A840BM92_9RHOO|nr:exosortase B [Niveibacterium umoris]MBB4011607.1 exosortase B [Niveibacterium umoris]
MSATTPTTPQAVQPSRNTTIAAWAVLLVGLGVLYVPTFSDLLNGLWSTDQNAHGPIVLGVSMWFLWFKSRQLAADPSIQFDPAPYSGGIAIVVALAMYIVGRSQAVYLLEVGSLIPLLAGGVAVFFGTNVLRRIWFAFFFMFFMIPLPGSITDTLTQPMKIAVSWGAEHVLYWLDYPIARNGVVLSIGPYQLLVADACAGLNSLFTLEALGLLYLNVTRHETAFRNILLATLIVPISFTANLIRVVTLSLITFHMGDEAGQGFLHKFSGMVLFISALALIIVLDGLLRRASVLWYEHKGLRS